MAARDEALYARIQELEGRVERMTNLLGTLLDDEDRHARLTDLAERTGAALRSLETRADAVGIGQPRFECIFTPLF